MPGTTWLGRKSKKHRDTEKAKPERHHVAAGEARCQGITSKSQPHGDTQINRKGIIYMTELASKNSKSLAKQL